MVDPHNITNFKRSEAELEEFALFTVAVAGKTAVVISEKIDRFLWLARARAGRYYRKELKQPHRVLDWSPFHLIHVLHHISQFSKRDEITACMKKAKLGKYALLQRAYLRLVYSKFDLRKCSCEQLENVPGIGFKTSRFFVLHSRPDQNIAVLDTHILHFLRDNGVKAPKNTPSSKATYERLESKVLQMAKAANKTVADFDLEIWRKYTKTKPREALDPAD